MTSERKCAFGFNLDLFCIFFGAKHGIQVQSEILKRELGCICVHLVFLFGEGVVNSAYSSFSSFVCLTL